MESRKSNGLSYVILAVVIANLALTLSLWLNRSEPISGPPSSAQSLPDYADSAYLASLADRMITLFNSQDYVTIYEGFDELAKAQIGLDDVEREMGRLSEILGKARNPAYVDHQASKHGVHDVYVLKYDIRLYDGAFDKGKMTISVVDRNNQFGVVGVNMIGGSTN